MILLISSKVGQSCVSEKAENIRRLSIEIACVIYHSASKRIYKILERLKQKKQAMVSKVEMAHPNLDLPRRKMPKEDPKLI